MFDKIRLKSTIKAAAIIQASAVIMAAGVTAYAALGTIGEDADVAYPEIGRISNYGGLSFTDEAAKTPSESNRTSSAGAKPEIHRYSATATYDDEIVLNNPEKTGYTFLGWTLSGLDSATATIGGVKPGTTSVTTPTTATKFKNLNSANNANVALTARWNANTYYINTIPGYAGANPVQYTARYDTPVNISNLSRNGYRFQGWNITGMNEGLTHYYGNNTTTETHLEDIKATSFKNLTSMQGAIVSFNADWEAIGSRVTFVDDLTDPVYNTIRDGSGTQPSYFESVAYDSPMPALTAKPSKYGYDFAGFYLNRNKAGAQYYKSNGTSNRDWDRTTDTTLYAGWTPKSRNLNITYVQQDYSGDILKYFEGPTQNSGEYATSYSIAHDYNERITVTAPSVPGRTFTNWNVSGDLANEVTTNIDSTEIYGPTNNTIRFYMPNSDISLNAVYTNHTVTIQFYTSGPRGAGYYSTKTYKYGTEATIEQDSWNSGNTWTFLGWSRTQGATTAEIPARGADAQPNKSSEAFGLCDTTTGQTIRLYEVWARNTLQVIYNVKDSRIQQVRNAEPIYREYQAGNYYYIPSFEDLTGITSLTGYSFRYWADANDNNAAPTPVAYEGDPINWSWLTSTNTTKALKAVYSPYRLRIHFDGSYSSVDVYYGEECILPEVDPADYGLDGQRFDGWKIQGGEHNGEVIRGASGNGFGLINSGNNTISVTPYFVG